MSSLKNLQTKSDYAQVCYSLNNTYKLKMAFNDCGDPIDPTSIEIVVTKPDLTNEVLNNATKVEIGFYYVEYTFDQSGKYNFEWQATIKNVVQKQNVSINIEDKARIETLSFGLDFNELIALKVLSGIGSQDGLSSLKEDNDFSFSTEYNPFYCSV